MSIVQTNKMEIGFENKLNFEQMLKTIGTLVDEISIQIDQEGIYLRTMDPSHVALIDISFNKGNIETYNVEGNFKINVRVDELIKVLAQFEPKERIKLELNSQNLRIMNYEGFNVDVKQISEPYNKDTPLPKLSFNSKFVLEDIQIKTLIKRSALTEYFTIITKENNNNVEFNGKSDGYELKQVFKAADIYNNGSLGIDKSTYSADYLIKFFKSFTSVKPKFITFEYSEKMPLRVEINLGYYSRIHFYLAPRIQD